LGLVLFCQLVIFPLLANVILLNGDHDGASNNNLLFSTASSKQRTLPGRSSPDGTFNGGPIYLQKNKPLHEMASHVHCVGEKYQKDTSWMERSCHFTSLFCYNASAHDYVVFNSEPEFELARQVQQREFMHVSDIMQRLDETNAVAIGGINLKWGHTGIPRLKWFPKIVPVPAHSKETISYYELPPATIMIPFHSMNGANPGHHVWDDYLPIYTLLDMFQLNDPEKYDLLPIRYKLLDGERGLWASCDLRPDKTEACEHIMNKFLPLLAGLDSPYQQLYNNENAPLVEHTPQQSDLVCARHGVAGIGSLTDHGLHKAHGWEEVDYKTIHNHGRGGQLYAFRNFMMRNVRLDPAHKTKAGKPHKIIFSVKSSDIFIRNMDFERQIELVKENFPEVLVESYTFKEHTLLEQLQVASTASIYVTTCGGGAVTGMFLPAGGSLLIYYAEDGGLANGKMNNKPALLDWDLFNAMSHLRVHWIPRNTRKSKIDENALVMLIRHELNLMDSGAFVT